MKSLILSNYKILILSIVIHIVDTLSYSVRLNSVKTGQFALTMSLFNIISILSRTANTLLAPMMGALIDYSIDKSYDPIMEIRMVIFASTIGTFVGILLIPTFLKFLSIAVGKLETEGSIPELVVQALSISNIKKMAKTITKPTRSMLHDLRYRNIPKRILILNAFITGIYTCGVLSANYAAVLVPEHRVSAVGSSGIINGVATILLTMVVDPRAAIITDEAYRGKRQYGDVKALVIMLIGTKLIGTLLAQLFVIPAAEVIAAFYR